MVVALLVQTAAHYAKELKHVLNALMDILQSVRGTSPGALNVVKGAKNAVSSKYRED